MSQPITSPVSKVDFEFENYNLTLQQLKGFIFYSDLIFKK